MLSILSSMSPIIYFGLFFVALTGVDDLLTFKEQKVNAQREFAPEEGCIMKGISFVRAEREHGCSEMECHFLFGECRPNASRHFFEK